MKLLQSYECIYVPSMMIVAAIVCKMKTKARFHVTVKAQINKSLAYLIIRRNVKV